MIEWRSGANGWIVDKISDLTIIRFNFTGEGGLSVTFIAVGLNI